MTQLVVGSQVTPLQVGYVKSKFQIHLRCVVFLYAPLLTQYYPVGGIAHGGAVQG